MYDISSLFDNLTDGITKITSKLSDTSVIKILDLKVLCTKVFVRIWSVAAADFLVLLLACLWLESYHFDILNTKHLAFF